MRRHKKILGITKGQRGTKHRLFRRANEAALKSMAYATRDRRARKGDMRRLWITRINAGARQHGMSYSRLMQGLHIAQIEVNRKMLADLAVQDPSAFAQMVQAARQALENAAVVA